MCEIIIIGSGLAGLSAAIQCAEKGKRAIVVSDQPSGCAQSVLAAGGINAALNHGQDDDTIQQHEEDTYKAGCYLADKEAVHNLASNAPSVIQFLEECGVIFSRNSDGEIAQRYFGGQKKKRTCYSNANIGKQLVSGLEQRVRYYEDKGLIKLMDHHIFLEVIKEEAEIRGAVFFDRYTGELLVLNGPVIVAAGGMSGLYGKTTGSAHSDGSVTAAIYLAGARMANLEMIQYHPTTIRTKSKNMLISEAARGEGGRLFAYRNGEKWYFCEEWYGERGNLMPRDVVSRAIYRVLHGKGADQSECVWLDLTQLDKNRVEHELGEVRSLCQDYLGIDPVSEPIPVVPGIHYFMGGIWVDVAHRTSLKGLYAAGECCSQYHGANRLGGNSTLGAVYGGKCAAISCCDDCDKLKIRTEYSNVEHQDVVKRDMMRKLAVFAQQRDEAIQIREKLQEIMENCMGIIRNQTELAEGKERLNAFISSNQTKSAGTDQDPISLMDIYNYHTEALSHLGEAAIQSALARKESRGAHYRTDYPDTSEKYAKPTYITLADNMIKIGKEN